MITDLIWATIYLSQVVCVLLLASMAYSLVEYLIREK